MFNNKLTGYKESGFADRYDYFTNLSEVYKVPVMKIILMAEKLGQEQDFDGLVDWVCKEAENAIQQNRDKY